MKVKGHIQSFREFKENLNISDVSDSFNIGIGKYTLYNFDDLPLPIEITKIDGETFEFESWYSPGNKHEWEDKFIGTEMEGLIYDPFGADFEKSEIERVDGDKIYLIPR
jgi:hypothetical protein